VTIPEVTDRISVNGGILRQADSVSTVPRVQDPRPAQPGFRHDIEGLRAVAVLAVVLFHAEVPGVGGGFIGVDVFFVISGFLITGMLWRELGSTGGVRLRRFYGARARRLLPASATVGVITAIGAAMLLPPLQARTVFGDGIASALYVANYRFGLQDADYLVPAMPPSVFQHYWSLGVEEQFYLVWPALMIATGWLVRRLRRRTPASPSPTPYLVVLALVAAVSFALSLAATYVVPAVAFYSLPTRAWQLAVGGLVALTAGQWQRLPAGAAAITGWAGLALVLLACTLIDATTPYPGSAALLPVIGTALVIGAGCATPAQGCGRVLALAPMRAVGRVSYSWYLWHWPVLLLAPPLLGHPLGLAGRLAAATVSAALAVLTLHAVENPLRFAAPIRRSPARSLAVGGVATAVAACVGLVLLVVVPTPVGRGAPAPALTITAAPDPAGPNRYDTTEPLAMFLTGCLSKVIDRQPRACASGDIASATTVALLGDSNATMWAPAVQQVAAQRHWRLETLAKAACPPMNLPIINPHLRRKYTECQQWRAQILARLRAEHPRLVVLSMWRGYSPDFGFTSYNSEWIHSLTGLVQQLRGLGAQVLVLGPIPDPHILVPICLSAHLDDATACSPARSTAVNQAGIAAEAAATNTGGGHYADITDLFCTDQRCPVIVGNTLVYPDIYNATHVTVEYSRQLGPAIGALADRALANAAA
jgi:peptidoglycan/LPS O-acetylase OafA/YrhL